MVKMNIYRHETRRGPVLLRQNSAGTWVFEFDGEVIVGAHTPQAAVDDLVGGHTWSFAHSSVVASEVSADLRDWQKVTR